jgi:hypothetical protein
LAKLSQNLAKLMEFTLGKKKFLKSVLAKMTKSLPKRDTDSNYDASASSVVGQGKWSG